MIVMKMGLGTPNTIGRWNLRVINKAPIGAMMITHSTGEMFIKHLSGIWVSSGERIVINERLAAETATRSSTLSYPESRRL